MKKLFLLFASALLIPTANAVEEDIHEKCLKASDYKGCIEVFSGAIKDQIKPGTQNVKLNIDTQVIADGNQCPSEFAYAGGGYCRRVVCEYAGYLGLDIIPTWLERDSRVTRVEVKCDGANGTKKKFERLSIHNAQISLSR